MAHEPGRSDPIDPAGPGGSVGSGAGPAGGGVTGRDPRQTRRLIGAGVVLVIGLIFILQNRDKVETTFLVFTVTTRLWVGLVCSLALGAVLGHFLEAAWQKRRRRSRS